MNSAKTKRNFFIIVSTVALLLILGVLYLCFTPYVFCGSFDVDDYSDTIQEYQAYVKNNGGKLQLETTEKFDSIWDANKVYSLVKKLNNDINPELDPLYIIRFDSENRAWYVYCFNRAVFSGYLYEGHTWIISETGELMLSHIGG